jgi:hypothetical protein
MFHYALAIQNQALNTFRIVRFGGGFGAHRLNKDGKFVPIGEKYEKYNSRRHAIQMFKKFVPNEKLFDNSTGKVIK